MIGATITAIAFLTTGVYLVAVLERLSAARVAGARFGFAAAAAGPVTDAAVLLVQRTATTERPDLQTWVLSPALLTALAATMLAPVPLGPGFAAAESQHGILLVGAAAALVIVPVFLQGWSPNSIFPLVGAYRMLSQGLSYMIPLALALIAAVLPAESLSIGDIVADQHSLWNVVRMPLGLPVFLIAAAGLAFYGPLALPSSPDLAGGIELEASGVDVVSWRFGQRAVLVAASAVAASVFLGGWQGPFLPGIAWLAVKTGALLLLYVVVRQLVPRLRPEQFVTFGWVVLLPVSLLNIFATGWWLL